ncbi:hypothetical protein MPH_06324 [Macrophomina phaseolina MS6]|uniref:Uncharacterized protein n=1 Tax=Macrophomina phaseolina (strain MS6) TaxID=1126212 RepID=K2RPA7_MACPH|nr:hypothetical protein MPH_06324 [Macrophomina phaseolina MS6]
MLSSTLSSPRSESGLRFSGHSCSILTWLVRRLPAVDPPTFCIRHAQANTRQSRRSNDMVLYAAGTGIYHDLLGHFGSTSRAHPHSLDAVRESSAGPDSDPPSVILAYGPIERQLEV